MEREKIRRIDNINRLIDRKQRSFTDSSSQKLFKCNVCWTCKFFTIDHEECVLTYMDVEKVDKDGSVFRSQFFGPDYYENIYIKKPGWFRCKWWKERK